MHGFVPIFVVKYIGIVIAAVYGVLVTLYGDKFHTTQGDKRVFTRNGRVGIAIISVATLLGVLSGIDQDTEASRAENEAIVARQKLADKMQVTLGTLQLQTARIERIGDTLNKQSTETKKTADAVAISAASTKESAAALHRLVDDVGTNVKTTNRILRDSKEAVTAFNVRLLVAFDAVAFDDQLQQGLLTPDLRSALEKSVPISGANQERILAALDDHRREILEILFRRWRMTFHLIKRDKNGVPLFRQDLTFTAGEGASAFFTAPDNIRMRTPQGHIAVGCQVGYTVPLTGIPGLRTTRDLSGGQANLSLIALPNLVGLRQAYAFLGAGGGGGQGMSGELTFHSPADGVDWQGSWEYSVLIRNDTYRIR
jgi:hypothetical protein